MDQICFGVGKMWASFQNIENVPRVPKNRNSFLRIGASLGAQALRNIPIIPSGPSDFDFFS